MEIILHTGVHRTATTSFQHWLRANADTLADHGTAVWEIQTTRSKRFSLFGLPVDDPADTPRLRQATARMLRFDLSRLEKQGIKTLLISEENLLGGVRRALSQRRIYPEAVDRLNRLNRLFGDRITRFAFGLRSYADFWTSCIGLMAARGDVFSRGDDFSAIAADPRGWPDLAGEIADAFPNSAQSIWTFERFKADPRAQLTAILGRAPVAEGVALTKPVHRNSSPKGDALRALFGDEIPLTPEGNLVLFTPEEEAALAARYTADLAWFETRTTPGFTYLD